MARDEAPGVPGIPGMAPEHAMEPRSARAVQAVRDGVVDIVLYRDGQRVGSPTTLADGFERLHRESGLMAWIVMYHPAEAQLLAVADEFGLHELVVEDAVVAHQRPKLERYGDTLFMVLRAARYVDDREEVRFGEVHVFAGRNYVLTVQRGETPDLAVVRRRMEDGREPLALGPEAILYAILDAVVDGYAPVIAGLQDDIDEIETEVFCGEPAVSRRIYALSREVIEFQRATGPLLGMLDELMTGFSEHGADAELQRYLRDVADHATTVTERVDGFRQMLGDILTVNATLVSQQQNEETRNLAEAGYAQNEQVKQISAWAAILFAPTLIGTVYGMNFRRMPELSWTFGYPFAVALMLGVCVTLYAAFKKKNWL